MTRRSLIVAFAALPLAALVVVGATTIGTPATAAPVALTGELANMTAAAVLAADDAEFQGNNKCKKCHIAEYKSWEETAHAKAFETLKPGNATEEKSKHGLDPQKDYTKDQECLACHTVGFGKPGGYEIPADGDKKAIREASRREGAGCEVCHGAGGAYIDFHEEIFKEKKEYTQAEMDAHGMTKISETTCKQCHNDKSPTIDPNSTFDFEAMKAKSHEVSPLKYRKG